MPLCRFIICEKPQRSDDVRRCFRCNREPPLCLLCARQFPVCGKIICGEAPRFRCHPVYVLKYFEIPRVAVPPHTHVGAWRYRSHRERLFEIGTTRRVAVFALCATTSMNPRRRSRSGQSRRKISSARNPANAPSATQVPTCGEACLSSAVRRGNATLTGFEPVLPP
jgi:hypothetical protein